MKACPSGRVHWIGFGRFDAGRMMTLRSVTTRNQYLVATAVMIHVRRAHHALGPVWTIAPTTARSPGSSCGATAPHILSFCLCVSATRGPPLAFRVPPMGWTRRHCSRGPGECQGEDGRSARVEGLAPAAQQGPPLELVQASPDPVGLTDAERVLQALLADGAPGADGLGLGLPGVFLVLALEVVGGEEQRRLLAAAGRAELPTHGPLAG